MRGLRLWVIRLMTPTFQRRHDPQRDDYHLQALLFNPRRRNFTGNSIWVCQLLLAYSQIPGSAFQKMRASPPVVCHWRLIFRALALLDFSVLS